jgi:hypothetical protein
MAWQDNPQQEGGAAMQRRGYGLGETAAAPPTLGNSGLQMLAKRLDAHYEFLRRANPHDLVTRMLGGAPNVRPGQDVAKADGIVQILHMAMDAIESEVNSLGDNVDRLRNEL